MAVPAESSEDLVFRPNCWLILPRRPLALLAGRAWLAGDQCGSSPPAGISGFCVPGKSLPAGAADRIKEGSGGRFRK